MKVLVVDDDIVSRMVLMHLVDSCGAYDIVEADDGEDAWNQLRQGLRPAICFCDLRMPRLSGMELLARVKADTVLAGMRFVLASSANDHATMAQASSLGAAGYLVKPFEQDMVLAQLAGLAPRAVGPEEGREEAENPRATMMRLGIDDERLLLYLGGFESQLSAAGAGLAAQVAQVDAAQAGEARARIARLHAGCITLGLGAVAAGLDQFATGGLDAGRLQAAIDGALAAVRRQAGRIRAMHEVAK